MATRFYLPSTGAADVSPDYSTGWELTSGAARRKCVTTKISSAMTDFGVAETSGSGDYDVLIAQYVSAPIDGAGTLSGTFYGLVRAMESDVAGELASQITVKVVSNDGATVRGTPLALDTGGGGDEWPITTALSKWQPRAAWLDNPVAITSVDYQDGDRIVIEIGYRAHNWSATSYTGTERFGDASGSDLTDENQSADNNPWCEFSATLSFQAGGQEFTRAVNDTGSTSESTVRGATLGRKVGWQ